MTSHHLQILLSLRFRQKDPRLVHAQRVYHLLKSAVEDIFQPQGLHGGQRDGVQSGQLSRPLVNLFLQVLVERLQLPGCAVERLCQILDFIARLQAQPAVELSFTELSGPTVQPFEWLQDSLRQKDAQEGEQEDE